MGSQSASSARTARSFSAPRAAERGPAAASVSAWSRLGGEPHGRLGGRGGARGAGQQTLGGLELTPLVGAHRGGEVRARRRRALAPAALLGQPHRLRAELLGAAQLAAQQVHERELREAVHRDLLVALLAGERERLLQVRRGGHGVARPQPRGPEVGEREAAQRRPAVVR